MVVEFTSEFTSKQPYEVSIIFIIVPTLEIRKG